MVRLARIGSGGVSEHCVRPEVAVEKQLNPTFLLSSSPQIRTKFLLCRKQKDDGNLELWQEVVPPLAWETPGAPANAMDKKRAPQAGLSESDHSNMSLTSPVAHKARGQRWRSSLI